MKTPEVDDMYVSIISAGLAVLLALPSPARAQTQTQDQITITSSSMPVYVPPPRGAPVGRIGGGSRRPDVNLPALYVLAPNHTGFTTKGQPTLYWFVSGPTETRVRITVHDGESIDPLLETDVGAIRVGGIHKLSLAAHGVALQSNVDYQWFVSLVADPGKRSKDIVSGGTIRRVKPSTELRNGLSDAETSGKGFVYAENGIWYDAIEVLSRQIERSPEDGSLRAQRAALLEQVGLMEVAAFDRSE